VCSVFKVYNASSGRDLKVSVNGQPLRHKPHPVYFNVTLDRTINYKQQLTKIADKVKSCNNLLMKLTNSSLGANSNTLWSSTLAVCYSAGEYCCPVWAHTSHTDLTDLQLNSVMRIITGTLCSSPLPRLPDLCIPKCAYVANTKRCYILSTSAHRPSWRVDCSNCTQMMMLPTNGLRHTTRKRTRQQQLVIWLIPAICLVYFSQSRKTA